LDFALDEAAAGPLLQLSQSQEDRNSNRFLICSADRALINFINRLSSFANRIPLLRNRNDACMRSPNAYPLLVQSTVVARVVTDQSPPPADANARWSSSARLIKPAS